MADNNTGPVLVDWLNRLWKLPSGGRRSSVLIAAAVGLLALLYLIYSLIFLGRVYPNVYVGSQKYSGLNTEQVKSRLTEVVGAALSQPLSLTYDGKTYTVSAKEANWTANIDQTAAMVYEIGRSGRWDQSFLAQVSAPIHRRRLFIQATYDENYLKTTIAGVAEAVDQPAEDASAEFQGAKLVVNHEKSGQTIRQEEIVQTVLNRWSSGSTKPIELTRRPQEPTIIIGDENEVRTQAETLKAKKLTLKWEGGQKVLTPTDINQLIDFVGEKSPVSLDGKARLKAMFTENKTKSYLQELATNSLNQPATEPKLGIKDGHLVILTASAPGRVVDIDTSAIQVLAALQAPESSEVTLTFKTEQPLISENNLDSLGIREMIGRGETSFAGSPTNRKANIANGVRLLQSSLVKPNTEFSTVKALGAVDGTTGFLPELVIKENKTTPEFGGGLCQVSTTLFRSVLNAGLKVTERQNHSYRVGYYEPPVGLDATIYLPRPDFKFLNDTGNYILVQGQVIGNKVVFELWGTKDGRSVSITDPIVTNILPPPPEVRTETDTLFVGEVKQTEKAHEGATAVVTYTVTRDGKVINKQTFKSVYKPWAAKFLVGTKVPDQPPPENPPQ